MELAGKGFVDREEDDVVHSALRDVLGGNDEDFPLDWGDGVAEQDGGSPRLIFSDLLEGGFRIFRCGCGIGCPSGC